MERYIKLNYHNNDYENTAINLAERIIYYYRLGQDYNENKSSFLRYYNHCFSDIEKFEKYIIEAFRYLYLADTKLEGDSRHRNSEYIFSDDYKIDCCFINYINPDDRNHETVYIDIGACKYYIL